MTVEIITTGDGSHSLYDPTLNETYHSRHGAIQESTHVFIEHGLNYFHQLHPDKAIRVFEVGFGTGLNALLTWKWAEARKVKVEYVTIEAFPIPVELALTLNHAREVESNAVPGASSNAAFTAASVFAALHEYGWATRFPIGEHFTFKKIQARLEDFDSVNRTRFPIGEHANSRRQPALFDVIYFDAFAPSRQPEMWTNDMLRKVVERMDNEAVFVTYCAKGQVKRDLAGLGLRVETLAGPPGKKEMTRGVK